MQAGAAVVALLWFSATAFGLAVPDSYAGPGAMPRARADCPPDCGGGSSSGSASSGPAFPMQPPDMPSPPGGYNSGSYPAPDQANGISIYNPSEQSPGSQGGYHQYPQQGQPGPPANGVQPPNYDAPPQVQPPAAQQGAPGGQQAPANGSQPPNYDAPPSAAPAPQQPPAAPSQAPAGSEQAPAQQPVDQAPVQQGPQQPAQQPGNSVNQPSTQPAQQQPQNPPPNRPTKEPDNTPVDPTDLAAAATRRGSQQAGEQVAQQGTQQATQQTTKEDAPARVVKQSGDLFKQDIQDGDHNPYTGVDNHHPQVKTPLPPQYDPNTGAVNSPGSPLGALGKYLEREISVPAQAAKPLGQSVVTNATQQGGQAVYQGLDALGRPTGVTARITPDMLGTGTRAAESIRPPGFAGQAADPAQARGHLLAKMLGGSGKVPENLVTLIQNPVNTPVMRGFEMSVAKAVEAGEVVDYVVTPLYKGSELMATAVQIVAKGSKGFMLAVTVLNG